MHGTVSGTLTLTDSFGILRAVMSSEQSQEAICKAFTVGAADYLIKPIRKNEVATLWHHIWRRVMAAGT